MTVHHGSAQGASNVVEPNAQPRPAHCPETIVLTHPNANGLMHPKGGPVPPPQCLKAEPQLR